MKQTWFQGSLSEEFASVLQANVIQEMELVLVNYMSRNPWPVVSPYTFPWVYVIGGDDTSILNNWDHQYVGSTMEFHASHHSQEVCGRPNTGSRFQFFSYYMSRQLDSLHFDPLMKLSYNWIFKIVTLREKKINLRLYWSFHNEEWKVNIQNDHQINNLPIYINRIKRRWKMNAQPSL